MNGRRNPAVPLNGRKLDQRDEDLLLFRELHKRGKERIATLLQPVSDEFEPNGGGNYALYRIASGKKGSGGYEFFPENNKNDYDWLKTPPATPLFPSLEMEANGGELVIQRELPIIQPLSRAIKSEYFNDQFAGRKEPSKASIGRPKSSNPKPKVPSRSITPSYRPTISSTEVLKDAKAATAHTFNHRISQPTICDPLNNERKNGGRSTIAKPTNQLDFLTSNLSKNLGTSANKTKPRSRGVSPLTRSTIPAQFPGFSDETPPNLKIRSTSVSRGRPPPTVARNSTVAVHQKTAEPISTKTKRQSCSPNVTRGRTVPEPKKETKGTQILGSKMVEKVMNARKSSSSTEEKDTKKELRGSSNIKSNGFARTKHTYGD